MGKSYSFGITDNGKPGLVGMLTDDSAVKISRSADQVAVINAGQIAMEQGPSSPAAERGTAPTVPTPETPKF